MFVSNYMIHSVYSYGNSKCVSESGLSGDIDVIIAATQEKMVCEKGALDNTEVW